MIDHLTIGVSDYARSVAFYKAALGALGLELLREFSAERTGRVDVAGFGERGKPELWLGAYGAQEPRLHVAMRAPNRAAVDAFYVAALAAGGRDNGPPGPRPHYHADYYGAFVLDPDGHNLEAVCHAPEAAQR